MKNLTRKAIRDVIREIDKTASKIVTLPTPVAKEVFCEGELLDILNSWRELLRMADENE